MPKDHERNISPMQEARQKIIQEKYNTLKTVLEDMIHNDEQITAPRVCELSGLSKSYLYHNEKAKKLFDEAKALAEKKASRSYISSYDLERTDLDINPHMRHDDMLLQYEEMKRKLYETYMTSFRINLATLSRWLCKGFMAIKKADWLFYLLNYTNRLCKSLFYFYLLLYDKAFLILSVSHFSGNNTAII